LQPLPQVCETGWRDPFGCRGQPVSGSFVQLNEPIQTEGQASQVDKAMNGRCQIALVISQAEMLFQIANRQFNGEAGTVDLDDLGQR